MLQERTREFKHVHAAAQRKLKHLFGMEMVEMGQREKPSLKEKVKSKFFHLMNGQGGILIWDH